MKKILLTVAKILIVINIIAVIIFSAGIFYWNNVDKYTNVYTNGANHQKTFYELIEVMCFANNDKYAEASLKLLNEDATVYDNYELQTDVAINWINPVVELKIEAKVDGNVSMGFIEMCEEDRSDAIEYKYYRVCNGDTIKTYLLINDVWYVTKENGKNVALDINKIVDELKRSNYEKWPGPCLDSGKATLYPSEFLFDYVNICDCGSIGSLVSKDITAEDFSDIVNKAIYGNLDQQTKNLVDWMKKHNYKCDIIHTINNIDKVDVTLPKDLDEIAIEGDVYEIIMTAFANIAK